MSTRVLTRFVRTSGKKNSNGKCEIPEPQPPTSCQPRVRTAATPATTTRQQQVTASSEAAAQTAADAPPPPQTLAQRLFTPKTGARSKLSATATAAQFATPQNLHHQQHYQKQQQRTNSSSSSSTSNLVQQFAASTADAASQSPPKKGGRCDFPDPHPPPCGVPRAPTKKCPADSRPFIIPNPNKQPKCTDIHKKPWRKPDCVEQTSDSTNSNLPNLPLGLTSILQQFYNPAAPEQHHIKRIGMRLSTQDSVQTPHDYGSETIGGILAASKKFPKAEHDKCENFDPHPPPCGVPRAPTAKCPVNKDPNAAPSKCRKPYGGFSGSGGGCKPQRSAIDELNHMVDVNIRPQPPQMLKIVDNLRAVPPTSLASENPFASPWERH